ncbi:multiple sugar transport system permease protein [Rhizobiales bacterium GAS191]|nr:carbohydrate ABC transporter membrane protein 1, CUT1 family [Rhizobiales bacterium GAS113]SEC41303.1 carbohydrate ABC transporter membrane protein 1, CUT1 family [Rhizobiales bacterium GAS188]SEC86094.1 multiple sugar transport system permease protein [Rhizobiales bacterium GAS191]
MAITASVDERAGPVATAARRRRTDLLPLLLLLPSIVLIGAVIAYPLLSGMSYSIHGGTLLKPGGFIGADNYRTLAGLTDFYNALRFSVVFAVVNVACCYLLGLGIALLMNLDVPGRAFFRVAFLLPWIIPSIVSVVSWRWLVADQSAPVNQFLMLIGVNPIYFLSSDFWAQAVVCLVKIWRSFPFMMVSILGALQGIDRSLYEAAALDGATRWQAFLHVTMPQLKGISIILCILMTIFTVNDFETPWLITQGGPSNATENLIILAYRLTFARNQVGLGSAVSFVTFLILMALAVLLLRRQREAS